MRIAEINACGVLHSFLAQHPSLYYSEFVPGVTSGATYKGARCEDLQCLTYPDDYFDIVLSSDTLEHVPNPEKAFNEIYRVLKPDGFHLFTVPVIPSQGATIRRARLVDGECQFLLAPAYHGSWGQEDMFVFTDFGMDIVHKLKLSGFVTDVVSSNTDDEPDVAFAFRSKKAKHIPSATKIGEYPMLEWTGERFLPWIGGTQIHYEHLHRYAFAAHVVKGKKVLDLGCGEGYGTYMLAREAEYVAGVEMDKPTVQHARSRYIKDNLEFIEGSILAVPIEGEKRFDAAVCFEGIEHIAEHDKLLSEVKRLLKDDGLFIVSTPNKAVYTDARDYHNPFHIKELHFDEFSGLLKRYFKHLRIFGQRVYAGSNMWSIHQHKSRGYIEEIVKKGDREFYFAERVSKEPVYFIALASNASLKPSTSITDSWLMDASNTFFNDYENRLAELNHTLQTRVSLITNLETNLQEKVSRIRSLESHIRSLESHIRSLESQIHSVENQIHSLENQIHSLENQMQQTQRGIPMQLVSRYQRVIEKLLRPGTHRRHYYELGLTGTRIILNEGWRSFWVRFKEWLLENMRSAIKRVWWRSTRPFALAGQALLPYYQRYVPLRVKRIVPDIVRRPVQRWLTTEQLLNTKMEYPEWIVRNDSLSNEDRLLTCNRIASFKYKPKFSILMPVSSATVEYLRQAVDSVLTQLYRSWELCVVYDRSTSRKMRSIMEKYGQKDSRVRPQFRATGGGICACANAALEAAIGDWIVVMGPDDVLSEHALYLLAEAANSHPDAAIVYSDHDYIDAAGRRFNPYFKPDWDYDLFLGQNYINPLSAYRADLAHRVGGVREGFEGAQDWDFALRVLESVPNADVHHIPFALYHQRATEDTFSRQSPAGEVDAAQRVVNEHFERTATAAVATPLGYSNHLRIRWELPKNRPMVSVIIPTKDQCKLLQACIDGLVNRTDYRPLEIVVVDNGSSEPDAVAFLDNIRLRENVKVVEDSLPFNFSRLVNLGVANSSGEICVLLNNDVDVINATWLDEMVSHALRPEVGAVGAKLYYANNTLQHAGVILGMPNPMGTVADRPDRCLPRKSHGYFNRLNLTRSLSCVAASCLATRRAIYESLGGFNEQDLAVSFNDIDFCLRVRQASYKVIWTPNAELYHYESISRGDPRSTPEKAARNKSERAHMRKQWGPLLDNDPYYNPNLSLTLPCFRPATISRARKPWSDVRGPDQDQMNRGGKGPKL